MTQHLAPMGNNRIGIKDLIGLSIDILGYNAYELVLVADNGLSEFVRDYDRGQWIAPQWLKEKYPHAYRNQSKKGKR